MFAAEARDVAPEYAPETVNVDGWAATRNAFQYTMREAFSEAVEQAVGRRVVGFLSQVHVAPDLSIETFILEPDGASGGAEQTT